jgi:hypothetical protein
MESLANTISRQVSDRMAGEACGTCYFFGFHGLEKFCWHPNHPYKISTTALGCPDWTDTYEKFLPGEQREHEKVTAENLTIYDAGRGAGAAGAGSIDNTRSASD